MDKIIYDGFEKNSLSDIWNQRLIAHGSLQIQSDIVRAGKHAVKITIHQGDLLQQTLKKDKTSERDELLEREDLWSEEGEGHSYSFSIFIPKNFPIVPTRLVLAQWKQYDQLGIALIDNPLIALRYVDGELFITLQTTEKKTKLFQTKEDIREKWLDFDFNIKFTRAKKGSLIIFMNKHKIVSYEGITAYAEQYNYPKPGRFYFKMGLYRDTINQPMTAYFDEYQKKPLINYN